MLSRLGLIEKPDSKMWTEWRSLAELVDVLDIPVTIAVVGKYTNLSDAYLSISKALCTRPPARAPAFAASLPLVLRAPALGQSSP